MVQLEKLSRGLVAIRCDNGIFLSWRLMRDEVWGSSKTGLVGVNFAVHKNGRRVGVVENSTNYLDSYGTMEDEYYVVALKRDAEVDKSEIEVGKSKTEVEKSKIEVEKSKIEVEKSKTEVDKCKTEVQKSETVKAFDTGENYLDIPIQKPKSGVTPSGEYYEYHANDMSVGDVDGDGEYEFIIKWEPENSHDVSIKGYTGCCYLDCYKLDGRLLWRLDMGVNIRAGAHYTQFMVYDFNGDGKAEMAVKTAPGTNMAIYPKGQNPIQQYITIPEEDKKKGYSHEDNYVCSSEGYRNHLKAVFLEWHKHSEVVAGRWPETLEECFGIPIKYQYPLQEEEADWLTDYFIKVYAKSRSEKNELEKFEGFIFKGPEYLTMFAGDGSELETIAFPSERVDDGLLWGDYSMNRIEPCNRVDRFLSGVAYLDGKRPYLIVCRGYYTRVTMAAYHFFDGHFTEHFKIDSGFVPMKNPFCDNAHGGVGTDPVYGILAGQGNHSLATADVDLDGCQEIIYGAATIDQDGSVLYSSYGTLPDGRIAKLGHGDALHVANIDPDRKGLEIFSVFEGGKSAPYGFALRKAENGEVIFGEYAETDLGRCMIGDILPDVRGYQVWVKELFNCKGELLPMPAPGTNQSIRWAADLSTQILDGPDIFGRHQGVVYDVIKGPVLIPKDVAVNNGTKGNACLIADIFGDFREELLLRRSDDSAIRMYFNTELTNHKLFTLMHDIQYRTGVAWQNNCYNQPCYPSFYYGRDMDFGEVIGAE